ncbi:O-antigen ligase family protein, partial [Patescibacteria group bacterium]|nr:O-antigen ligase family protein [Patescibacteria group bacterium]
MMLKILSSLFFIFLALFPFGQLTKIPLNFLDLPEVHLYLTDILVFLLVSSWLIWRLVNKKKKFVLPPLAKPIFLFTILALISLLVNILNFSVEEMIVAGLYLARWVFYAGLYFVLFDLKKEFKWLNWQNGRCFLIIIGSVVGIFGFIQYFLWPNLKALEVLHYDPHFYRVVGTFLDPGFTGLILVFTLLLIVDRWFEEKKKWLIPLALVIYSALALTYSRASWLVFLLAVLLVSCFKKSWKFLLVILALMGATYFLLPRPAGEGGKIERTYTIEARLTNYRQALVIAKDHPLFGVGFNTYRYAQRNYGFLDVEEWQVSHAGGGADASWLFVLATTGAFGFLSYLWLWGRALKETKKKTIVLVTILALIVHSLFLNSLFYPQIMAWFWILLAI